MNEQLLKMSGERADVLSSRKKLRKTLWGVATTPTPSPFVRPRVKNNFQITSQQYEHFCPVAVFSTVFEHSRAVSTYFSKTGPVE